MTQPAIIVIDQGTSSTKGFLFDENLKVHHTKKIRHTVSRSKTGWVECDAKEIINSLELEGVKAIIPTEDWEILGNSSLFPNSLKLSRETVSIPLYPSLTNDEIDLILSVLIKK